MAAGSVPGHRGPGSGPDAGGGNAAAEHSTVTLEAAPSPSTYGASVTFTATVTDGATGDVQFFDAGSLLGTGTLDGLSPNHATFSTSDLSVGTHATITATYAGDATYDDSSSTDFSLTVDQAPTTTTVASALNPSTFGASVTFTATVTSAGGTATGDVDFYNGAVKLGTGTLDGLSPNHATFSTSDLSVGTHASIRADYMGDTNFATSFSGDLSQEVDKALTTTTIESEPNPSTFGESVTFTAHVSDGLLVPTGTVEFFDNLTSLGTDTLDGSGDASVDVTTLGGGSHTAIHAHYAGTTDFAASTSTDLSQTVDKATPVLAWDSTPPGAAGPTDPGSTTVGAASYTPAASSLSPVTVTYSLHTGSSGCTLITGVVHFTAVGTCKIDADQTSDSNWNAATQIEQTITVAQASTTTTVSRTGGSNPSTFGESVTFTAHVSDGLLVPTGTVEFFDNLTSLGTDTLDGSGDASVDVTTLGGGSHTAIHAHYAGTTDFAASTSTDLSQTVDKATPVLAWDSTPPGAAGPTDPGSTTVGAASYTPAASSLSPVTVTYSLHTGSSGCTLITGVVHFTAVGTCKIDADQTSNSNWNAATQIEQTITVAQASTTTTVSRTGGSNPSTFGESVTFTAHVSDGLLVPTGTVEFFDNLTSLGTDTLDGSGDASVDVTTLGGGSHTAIHAHYAGTTDFAASTSTDLSQTVDKATPVLEVTSDVNPSVYGASVTFTAHVTSTAGTPTGDVEFFDGLTSLGTRTLASGVASVSTAALTTGSHSITIVYAGDTDFASGTSNTLDQQVSGTAVSTTVLSSLPNPSTYGQSVMFTATVSGASAAPPATWSSSSTPSARARAPSIKSSPDVATFSTSVLTAGDHSITAKYLGDSQLRRERQQHRRPGRQRSPDHRHGQLGPGQGLRRVRSDPDLRHHERLTRFA